MATPPDTIQVRELDRILSELQTANDELEEILVRQNELLVVADAPGLQESADKQSQIVDRLQLLLSRREAWLQNVTANEQPARSISDWVQQFSSPESDRWRQQLMQIKQSSDRVRRQSWRQWVVVQGAHRHQTELLQMIARNGRKTVGYGPNANPDSRGGAILDATA